MPYTQVDRPKVAQDAASLRSSSVGMKHKQHLKPANEKLWNMLLIQAKAKFIKFPSPSASAWVHEKYVKMGGRFIDTAKEGERNKAVKAAQEVREHHKKGKKK